MTYNSFAQVYDLMMDNVPYEQWVHHIETLFLKHGCEPRLIADLGCGTGTMTVELAQKGYEMTGIDLSTQMLQIAKEKARAADVDVLFLNQDMTELDLYGTMDAMISTCDALNYIDSEAALCEIFKRVNLFLEPKGLFIFDMNTIYKFKELLGSHTFAETYEDSAYIWENYFDEDEGVNEYQVTLFIKEKDNYERYEEIHYEYAYTVDKILGLLNEANLVVEGVYDAEELGPIHAKSERVFFVARENGKE
jgi:ubiquinone/menaquinone biosynthesis C-methylase UbiE